MSAEKWDDEHWVIDQLVEAVYAGTDTEVLGHRLMAGHVEEDDWASWDGVAEGVLLPFHKLDDPNDHDRDEVCDLFERNDTLPEDRLEALSDGDSLTEHEVKEWRRLFADYRFAGGDGEVDMWAVRKLTHADGRAVFVAETVFARILVPEPSTFLGAFRTSGEAIERIKDEGYISLQDYQARSVKKP